MSLPAIGMSNTLWNNTALHDSLVESTYEQAKNDFSITSAVSFEQSENNVFHVHKVL